MAKKYYSRLFDKAKAQEYLSKIAENLNKARVELDKLKDIEEEARE